jgi:DNA-binding transcriptional ArsR family regulator
MADAGVPARWRVTRAVRGSTLPAPAKLIMHVLADVADVGTAEIPPNRTPSLTVLARETGLGRSTVTTHLRALEAAGWIVRTKPTTAEALGQYERTRYQLCVPASEPMPVADLVPEPDEASAVADHPSVAPDLPSAGTDLPSVGAEHRDRSTTDKNQIENKPAEQPRPALSITQRSKGLTDAYALAEPMCKWPAVNAIVIRAIKSEKFTDDEIHDALLRLAKEGRGVTVESLRVELAGLPPSNGHKPSTTDQRVNAAQALKAQMRAIEGRTG